MTQYECDGCGRIEALNLAPEACSTCGTGYMIDLAAQARAEAEAALIAEQNDRFRASWASDVGVPGRFVVTAGVDALGPVAFARIVAAIMGFDRFDAENDPHGWHDFDLFEIAHDGGMVRLYWKLDLYDADYLYGSENPTDPTVTRRVLTVLLPEEY